MGGSSSSMSLGGGTGASPAASTAGGAASGAAMGTMLMPGWGTAAGAVLGGAMGYMGSRSTNSGLQASGNAAANATLQQYAQIRKSATVERTKRQQAARQIGGFLRARAADFGLGGSGTTLALDIQSDVDAAYSEDVLELDLADALERARLGLSSTLTEVRNSKRNVGLDAATSGLSGASSGLALGKGIQDMRDADDDKETR